MILDFIILFVFICIYSIMNYFRNIYKYCYNYINDINFRNYIYITKVNDNEILGIYRENYIGDAGKDIMSVEEFELFPNENKRIKTNIKMIIPKGYCVKIIGRSSNQHKLEEANKRYLAEKEL